MSLGEQDLFAISIAIPNHSDVGKNMTIHEGTSLLPYKAHP